MIYINNTADTPSGMERFTETHTSMEASQRSSN